MKKTYIQPAVAITLVVSQALMAASNGGADANIGGGDGGETDKKYDGTDSSSNKDDFDGGTGAKYNVWNEWDD